MIHTLSGAAACGRVVMGLSQIETCKISNQMRQTDCLYLFLVKCFLMIMESSPLGESCDGTTNCYSLTWGCKKIKDLLEN